MRQEVRGFTLIELMVTLAVMGVLLGIGVPSFQRIQQSTRVASSFHLLTTSLALARMAAVKNHAPVSICPSSDGRYCRGDTVWDEGWIVFVDPTRAKQPTTAEAVLHRFDRIGPSMALRSTAGRTLVRFQPSGMAYGSNLSFRLCSTTDQKHLGSVIVNNAGRTRSEHHDNTACPFAP